VFWVIAVGGEVVVAKRIRSNKMVYSINKCE
jgi:hypothetical protein